MNKMKSLKPLIASLFLSVLMLHACQTSESSFVKVENGKFVSEDHPSYFVGTNFWYGAILASEGEGGNLPRLRAELDTLKALGVTNLRVLVGGDGPHGITSRIEPTLQKEPGVYNDTIFWGLDRLLVEMAERDMKAVLYINNTWEWSGGFGMYLEWAGAGKALLPSVDGYQEYTEYVSQFMTNDKAKEYFADHVRHIVSRTNTITGKAYKDDPAIFSWQICNEPRCFSKDPVNRQLFVDWMWDTAELIKSIDPNHMVSSGSEGFYGCEQDMGIFEKIHACPDIDYMNIHIWPYNWSWVRQHNLQSNVDVAIANTDKYIDMHLETAENYGKPIVIEEFGYPRDDFQFAQGTPVTAKDIYYKHVFSRVIESARQGGIIAGANFWAWGGLASQSPTNVYWKKGDDYCGDPAQEQQGLYSVYASDTPTTKIISEAAKDIASAIE